MADQRLSQIQGHLSASFPQGLLAGQTAIVTGAGQGIGAATALLFAKEGARVLVTDVDGEKAAAIAAAITTSGGLATSVAGDLLAPSAVSTLIPTLISTAAALGGDGQIHILINNAGFTWDGMLHRTTDVQWATMLALHCTVPFQLLRAAAPYFRVSDGVGRCVVNVSSVSGLHGSVGQANYATAKMGVVGLTKTVAREWGPRYGVRANTVAFGSVETRLIADKELGVAVEVGGEKVALGVPAALAKGKEGYPLVPLRRAASAKEAAMAILAVASPLCSYVSGHTLEVTGGSGI
ncbi:hypothetical protein EDC01DRAFT_692168 [Geopyxis carbonaria]|nr:hypothetical protein EDC01DRAFT_692168 [Geopyxis carbonaria]